MFLICKSSLGFSLDADMILNSECCSTSTEIADKKPENEDTKQNCCGNSCDCFCCAPIFTQTKSATLCFFHNVLIAKETILFTRTNYQYNFIFGVWQPPRLT